MEQIKAITPFVEDKHKPTLTVPITATGLQDEKSLAYRSMRVREVGKIAP